mgnify:CR=1 FL=1
MKRVLILSAAVLFCGVPLRAQVTKQVEVTKVYVPEVSKAVKLPIVPDMTDTVRLRPEIDYTVTPSALATNLSTEPFRPASVTYWEFNRPRPLYMPRRRIPVRATPSATSITPATGPRSATISACALSRGGCTTAWAPRRASTSAAVCSKANST